MTATVILPVFNSAPHLLKVLDALMSGDRVPEQVIVSHSGSNEPTAAIKAVHPSIIVLHSDSRMFAGQARNAGTRHAVGEILAFCDADTVPDAHWLRYATDTLSTNENAFVVGSVGYADSGGYWGLSTWISEFSEQAPWRPAGEQTGGASCNFVCRSADFRAVGGFPEGLAIGEDTLLFHRLRDAGLRQLFVPSVTVRHCNIAGLANFARHLFKHGMAFAELRRHHEIKGSAIIRIWPLSLGLWLVKASRIASRVLEAPERKWRKLAFFTPAILFGALIWQAGVLKNHLERLFNTSGPS